MSLRVFAEAHRLKIRRDEEFTEYIPGRDGQLHDDGDGQFSVKRCTG